MIKASLIVATAILFLSLRAVMAGGNSPPYASPVFYPFSQPEDSDYSEYRPVLSADAASMIFERTFSADPGQTKLYIADLATNDLKPLVNIASLRPDWCWNRANDGSLSVGPVAFSNDNGIYVLAGTNLTLLPNTSGMIYPAWYPNCRYLAVDVGQNSQIKSGQLTAQIDAVTGVVIAAPLANKRVWAGFPSVNQVDPNLVSFAGQFIGNSNYYNQDINYTWVTDRSRTPPEVMPMDRAAPAGPGFLQQFQARAGSWSPDGKWFAFESNRSCSSLEGSTYAIFIQDARGQRPAMQVTSCDWNANHPKWFPPASTGGRTMLIAALAQPVPINRPVRALSHCRAGCDRLCPGALARRARLAIERNFPRAKTASDFLVSFGMTPAL